MSTSRFFIRQPLPSDPSKPPTPEPTITGEERFAMWGNLVWSLCMGGLVIAILIIVVGINKDLDKKCGLLDIQAEAFNTIIENCTAITLDGEPTVRRRTRQNHAVTAQLGAESTLICQQICVNSPCTCPIPVGGNNAGCCGRQRACCVWNCATNEGGCPWS